MHDRTRLSMVPSQPINACDTSPPDLMPHDTKAVKSPRMPQEARLVLQSIVLQHAAECTYLVCHRLCQCLSRHDTTFLFFVLW